MADAKDLLPVWLRPMPKPFYSMADLVLDELRAKLQKAAMHERTKPDAK
jgi:hypothetical protein